MEFVAVGFAGVTTVGFAGIGIREVGFTAMGFRPVGFVAVGLAEVTEAAPRRPVLWRRGAEVEERGCGGAEGLRSRNGGVPAPRG